MKTLLLAAILGLALAAPAAALQYDQDVTPDVIFGSGNANGSFTTDVQTFGGTILELGLRGKLRFDENNLPQNIFNSNGDGTYSFEVGAPTGGAGWVSATTPIWNFEFSVNVDQAGASGAALGDFTYELGIDFDPAPDGAAYLAFDLITPSAEVPMFDHAIGDNFGTVVMAVDPTTYADYLAIYNVAQNSWNYEFFNEPPFDTFDPNAVGVYEIYLTAFAFGGEVAHTAISIVVGDAIATDGATWSQVKSLYR